MQIAIQNSALLVQITMTGNVQTADKNLDWLSLTRKEEIDFNEKGLSAEK
jgi:hypothetical protein